MSCLIQKYTLPIPSQTPTFKTLSTHTEACFLKARRRLEELEVWFEIDDENPKADATFYFLRDGEKIAKTLASNLLHLETLFDDDGALHVLCQIDATNFEWVLAGVAGKQVTPPTPEKTNEDESD